jgi:hypothetical protein
VVMYAVYGEVMVVSDCSHSVGVKGMCQLRYRQFRNGQNQAIVVLACAATYRSTAD